MPQIAGPLVFLARCSPTPRQTKAGRSLRISGPGIVVSTKPEIGSHPFEGSVGTRPAANDKGPKTVPPPRNLKARMISADAAHHSSRKQIIRLFSVLR